MTVSAGLGGGGLGGVALGGVGAAGGVGGLASTGAGNTADLIGLGIVLVAAGVAFLGLSTRRRTATIDPGGLPPGASGAGPSCSVRD